MLLDAIDHRVTLNATEGAGASRFGPVRGDNLIQALLGVCLTGSIAPGSRGAQEEAGDAFACSCPGICVDARDAVRAVRSKQHEAIWARRQADRDAFLVDNVLIVGKPSL